MKFCIFIIENKKRYENPIHIAQSHIVIGVGLNLRFSTSYIIFVLLSLECNKLLNISYHLQLFDDSLEPLISLNILGKY